ncbi:MAG: hypothetical protein EOP00_24345 [Pedobacter sp.]|nr:MAG: hypothetical protein EOP00_24345 [Pedobacter sp.]
MNKLFLFFAVILIISFHSCRKSCRKAYDFVVPVKVYSANDTLSVKDTLWVEMDFSDKVLDYQTNQTYTLENFDFKTAVILRRIEYDTSNTVGQPGAYNKFDFVNKIGAINDWSHEEIGWGILRPVYENNRYRLKAGFIPNDTGVFFIYFFRDMLSVRSDPIKVLDNNCEEYMSFMRVLVNDGNTNFDLLQRKSKLREVRDEITIWQDSKATYTFYVKP